ncbi:hypothetical protein [Vibrio nigripulchritudo]|uniref:hypothetical protein n=1 Tax=Vibrio nigripulchritudo TaxID=28173 RepID=UPI0005FA0F6C|nr:hypothetical protein [Vibrio nigripulchritudo]KJY79901.1 hypothetical protein TW74_05970 [Vibrio nigripulchritudo]
MSRREAKKQMFYEALRVSLKGLVKQGLGGQITQNAVIANATFPDGTKVGVTTLYGKDKNKEFIHRDFMLELDDLIREANKSTASKKRGRKATSVTEKLSKSRSDYRELEEEYDSVLAQLSEMVEGKKNVNSASNENRVKTLEADLYVVASLLNRRIDGCIKEISDIVENYENKYSGQDRLTLGKERVSRLERRIMDSKITPIFGTMNES